MGFEWKVTDKIVAQETVRTHIHHMSFFLKLKFSQTFALRRASAISRTASTLLPSLVRPALITWAVSSRDTLTCKNKKIDRGFYELILEYSNEDCFELENQFFGTQPQMACKMAKPNKVHLKGGSRKL